MRSVLITGAAGFLGREFVKRHLADGDAILGIDDRSSEHSFWLADLREQDRLEQDAGAFFADDTRHWDLAYHFAAPVGGRLKIELDPMFNADSLRLDSLFYRWATKCASVAVYPSSSAVYGVVLQEGEGQILSEGMFHPANNTWPAPDEVYGFTKLVGEKLALTAQTYGLNTLCIRPFSGYGEGQSLEYPVPSIARRVVHREDPVVIWGSGAQRRDFIHVDDVVGATLARINAGIEGYQSMNIASGQALTFAAVAQLMAEIVGYDPQIVNDISKPEGVHSRWGDPTLMRSYYQPKVGLRDGLMRELQYVRDNQS